MDNINKDGDGEAGSDHSDGSCYGGGEDSCEDGMIDLKLFCRQNEVILPHPIQNRVN